MVSLLYVFLVDDTDLAHREKEESSLHLLALKQPQRKGKYNTTATIKDTLAFNIYTVKKTIGYSNLNQSLCWNYKIDFKF